MLRLDFRLDEFLRVSWASEDSKKMWWSVFSNIASKFSDIEIQAVAMGIRQGAIQRTGDLVALSKELMKDNLYAIPIKKVNKIDRYQAGSAPFDPTKPWDYEVVIGRADTVGDMVRANHVEDWDRLGEILGYPACCRKFFSVYWVDERWMDTTLPMTGGESLVARIDPRNNILLRWLGLRAVSHLPCSFTCKKTRDVASAYGEIAASLNYGDDWNQLLDILSWPLEWSSLHGIAEIITPVCKITTSSDALATKHMVRLVSDNYPDKAGRGIVFPFVKDTWTENGFIALKPMLEAHRIIIETLRPYKPLSVLDLGCGNMELIKRIERELKCIVYGVDLDPNKKPTKVMDLYDVDEEFRNWDFVLCSIRRTTEAPERWRKLEDRLIANGVNHLLLYDYDTNAVYVKDLKWT